MDSSTRKRTTQRDPGAARRSTTSSPGSPKGSAPARRGWLWPVAFALALQVVTCAAYWPALRGAILWDDDMHITKAELRSADGLRRIWFEPGATQQYYPVVHSAFWLQYRLWGDSTPGYHVVNVALHGLSAFLIWIILRRLSVPGAALAAIAFALHPVHVESVAWITELKNTMSGVFYLASALVYLRFDRTRQKAAYGLALGLFALAILSKSVTATLPASLLVVLWWQRGSVDVKRDVLPLLPMVAMGAIAGLATVWVERTMIGAQGIEYQFTIVERCLIAGRVVWFYLGKLAWPFNLAFMYPRWIISQGTWWQYLFPIGLVALAGVLWRVGSATRAPLAALLLFCAAIFPAAGFVNVYPFRYSFVADHFQYLASIPVLALAASALARLARFAAPSRARLRLAAAVPLLAVLGVLTWSQSRLYADSETLYRATIRANPSSWMARLNLGALKADEAPSEASELFQEALKLNPDLVEAHFNLGRIDEKAGRPLQAAEHYRRALQIRPDEAAVHSKLGTVLRIAGQREEAIKECERALQLQPDLTEAHLNLAALTLGLDNASAETHLRAAQQLSPSAPEIRYQLANLLQTTDRPDEALVQYAEALRLRPDYPEAHNNLGNLLGRLGRSAEAIAEFTEAIRLKPDYSDAYYYYGNTLMELGRLDEAAQQYRLALQFNPGDAAAHNNLGTLLEAQGRPEEAAAQFEAALRVRPDLREARDGLERVMPIVRSTRKGAAR